MFHCISTRSRGVLTRRKKRRAIQEILVLFMAFQSVPGVFKASQSDSEAFQEVPGHCRKSVKVFQKRHQALQGVSVAYQGVLSLDSDTFQGVSMCWWAFE